MHEGETPRRQIHGEAKLGEAKKLLEDGIPVIPLPFLSPPVDPVIARWSPARAVASARRSWRELAGPGGRGCGNLYLGRRRAAAPRPARSEAVKRSPDRDRRASRPCSCAMRRLRRQGSKDPLRTIGPQKTWAETFASKRHRHLPCASPRSPKARGRGRQGGSDPSRPAWARPPPPPAAAMPT